MSHFFDSTFYFTAKNIYFAHSYAIWYSCVVLEFKMKKVFLLAAVSSSLILTGCQLTGSEASAAPANFSDMSCEEIKSSLDTQKDMIDNIDNGGDLLSMVGMDSGTQEAKSAAVTAYQTSVKAAKPIVKIKKCDFSL